MNLETYINTSQPMKKITNIANNLVVENPNILKSIK